MIFNTTFIRKFGNIPLKTIHIAQLKTNKVDLNDLTNKLQLSVKYNPSNISSDKKRS